MCVLFVLVVIIAIYIGKELSSNSGLVDNEVDILR